MSPKKLASGEQIVGPVTSALIKARMLIANPAKWTRGAFARDDHNRSVNPVDGGAVCWCASGAIRKVFGHEEFEPKDAAMRKGMDFLAAASREYMKNEKLKPEANCITVVNDGSGHQAVMTMYNRAIILAKGE